MTTVMMLGATVLVLGTNAGAERFARGYAYRFALTHEAECPQMFGKAFWFTCAAEVRQRHPPPTLLSSEGAGNAAPVVGRTPEQPIS